MRTSQRVMGGVLGAIVVLVIAAAIWIEIGAPEPPELSGERTTRTYDFANFDSIELSGEWQLTVERGDAWRVTVSAPAEIADNVEVRVSGDVLDIAYEGPWLLRNFGLEATITMPALESLDLSGASTTTFSGFEGGSLSLDVSGAGDLRGAASRFGALTLDASGAVNVDLGDVPVTDAAIDVSGTGNVTLRMAGARLTGDLSGAANLEYYGTVSEESVDRSGFVSVRRRD